MPPRKQPRRIARELTLLSLSQIKGNFDKLEQEDLNNIILASIRTLTAEIQDSLEEAAAEIKRSHEKLLKSETTATNLHSARTMIKEAMELTQNAINRLGTTVELPENIQLAKQHQVREYTIELLTTIKRRREEIENILQESLKDWQLSRINKIDRDILKMAVAEILYLEIPEKVAINEAVELAKMYSDDEGYRFINGVLRRVSDRLSSSKK